MASNSTLRLNGEVDELQEAMVEWWASWRLWFDDGEGARRQRGLLGNGGRRCAAVVSAKTKGSREMKMWALGFTGERWSLMCHATA